MGERSDQITNEIAETRNELGANLHELERKVRDVTDWRKQFQKSPYTMLGMAFGGGVLLAVMSSGRSRPRNGYRFPEGPERVSTRSTNAGTRYELRKVADTWDSIKGALIGVAASQVKGFLRDAIPGFHDEYSKVEQQKRHESPMYTPESGAQSM